MKEEKTVLAVKVNYAVAERVKHFCRERGLKYGFFVEKAILEQQAISLSAYLKKRRV
jgi:hypothetical protein